VSWLPWTGVVPPVYMEQKNLGDDQRSKQFHPSASLPSILPKDLTVYSTKNIALLYVHHSNFQPLSANLRISVTFQNLSKNVNLLQTATSNFAVTKRNASSFKLTLPFRWRIRGGGNNLNFWAPQQISKWGYGHYALL